MSELSRSSYRALCGVRLSRSFCLGDFLADPMIAYHGLPNLPQHPELVVIMGRELCTRVLEPLVATFGALQVVTGYRSKEAAKRLQKEETLLMDAAELPFTWDALGEDGRPVGAGVVVRIPWVLDREDEEASPAMGWWVRDHLPCDRVVIPREPGTLALTWRADPRRELLSLRDAGRWLMTRETAGHAARHAHHYPGFPEPVFPSGPHREVWPSV